MKDILTPLEIAFLRRQALTPDDVFDARPFRQADWFRYIEEENKTVALGSRCRNGGHRLRSRRGHCVQCDTSKLAYQARWHANQYIYIAGSRHARLIKIGTCVEIQQRENKMRSERQGNTGDWEVIFYVKSKDAGALESRSLARLSKYSAPSLYDKDGRVQTSIELLKCPFSLAMKTVMEVTEESRSGTVWESAKSDLYEFTD